MAKKNKVSLMITGFDWVILFTSMAVYFFPGYTIEIPFAKFLINIFFVFYNVSFTIFALFIILAVIVVYFFTYTDSINDKFKILTAPFSEKGSAIRIMISYIKNFAIVFFCFEIGRKYASCLTIIFIVCSVLIHVIKNDVTAKSAKVALEHMNEDNNE